MIDRIEEYADGVLISYLAPPGDIDGLIEEGVWNGTGYDVSTRPLDADERARWVQAEADLDRRSKGAAVDQAVATLRQWAADAESTTVTNGNNNAVTQTVVDRLGVFFDRFADLIESDKVR